MRNSVKCLAGPGRERSVRAVAPAVEHGLVNEGHSPGPKGMPLWDVLAEGGWLLGAWVSPVPWPEGSAKGPPALTSNRGRFSKTSEEGPTPKGRRVKRLKRGDSKFVWPSCPTGRYHGPILNSELGREKAGSPGRHSCRQEAVAARGGGRVPKPGRLCHFAHGCRRRGFVLGDALG